MFKFGFFIFMIFNTGLLEKHRTDQQFQIYETSKFAMDYWINTKYIQDMDHNLPCLCNDSINYLRSIHVDQLDSIQYDEYHTTIPNGTLNFVRQTEPTPFYLIGVENNRYKISIDSKNIIAEIFFRNDTLYFIDSVNLFSFNRIQTISNIQNNQLDLNLLNLQLNKFGYPSLNRLLNTDSLELECNSWYGNINILSSESKQLLWILELKNKYLYIYKSEDYYRDPNDPFKTKLVMMLNLGNEDTKIYGEKEFLPFPNVKSQCEGDLIIKGKQKNNSFVNISNDSLSKLTYFYLTDDNKIEYDLFVGKEIFLLVNIDTNGHISTLDCIYNSTNSDLLFVKIKEILEQLQPFNPFYGSNNENLYGFAINFKFYKNKIEIVY